MLKLALTGSDDSNDITMPNIVFSEVLGYLIGLFDKELGKQTQGNYIALRSTSHEFMEQLEERVPAPVMHLAKFFNDSGELSESECVEMYAVLRSAVPSGAPTDVLRFMDVLRAADHNSEAILFFNE